MKLRLFRTSEFSRADDRYVRKNKDITGLQMFNIAFLAFLPIGLILTNSVSGITSKLEVPFIICNALLGVSYKRYKSEGTLKAPVILLRVLAVLLFAVILGTPFIGRSFENIKAMYLPKRQVFVYGVRTSADDVLPHKLPKDASEYYFRTSLKQMMAQDYSPHACLVVSCDRGSIGEYADNSVKNGFEKEQRDCTFEEYLQEKNIKADELSNDPELKVRVMHDYLNLPYYVFDSDSRGLTSDTEVYYCKASGSGCALDENSGIMIFWA